MQKHPAAFVSVLLNKLVLYVCVCFFFIRGLVGYNLSSIVYHYMESNLDYSREKKLPSTVSSLTKPRFIDLSKAIELYQQNPFEHRPRRESIVDQCKQSFVYGEFLKSATCLNIGISSNCDYSMHVSVTYVFSCVLSR